MEKLFANVRGVALVLSLGLMLSACDDGADGAAAGAGGPAHADSSARVPAGAVSMVPHAAAAAPASPQVRYAAQFRDQRLRARRSLRHAAANVGGRPLCMYCVTTKCIAHA